MNKPAMELSGVRAYFSATEERVERWRELHRIARNMANAGQSDKLRKEAAGKLAELAPLEDLCGYPGPALFARVREEVRGLEPQELLALRLRALFGRPPGEVADAERVAPL